MSIIWGISLMKVILIASCWGLPIYEMPQPGLEQQDSELGSIMTPGCSPSGRCWGWLSAVDSSNQEERNIPFQRSINAEQDGAWRGQTPIVEGSPTDNRGSAPVIRPMSSKPVKKDVFMSRSWGAGGMPFSVLYMNQHGGRSNHPPTPDTPKASNESSKKSSDLPQQISKQPNNRVTVRNGASQPRRQYSIIPQLFISYGWGPFGK